jgi:hypothetical protein
MMSIDVIVVPISVLVLAIGVRSKYQYVITGLDRH